MGLVKELLGHLPGLERVALVRDVVPIEDPRVRCPVIFMITDSPTPARLRFRTAVRRRS